MPMRKIIRYGLAAVVLYMVSDAFGLFRDKSFKPSVNSAPTETAIGPIVTTTASSHNYIDTVANAAGDTSVSIGLILPGELRGAGTKARHDFITKRGNQIGEKECLLLLGELASACRQGKHPLPDFSEFWINLRADIHNSVPYGHDTVARRLDVLRLEYRSSEKSPSGWPLGRSSRRAIYGQIVDDCRTVRQTYGNCYLVRVALKSTLIDGMKPPRLDVEAYADFAILTDAQLTN